MQSNRPTWVNTHTHTHNYAHTYAYAYEHLHMHNVYVYGSVTQASTKITWHGDTLHDMQTTEEAAIVADETSMSNTGTLFLPDHVVKVRRTMWNEVNDKFELCGSMLSIQGVKACKGIREIRSNYVEYHDN